MRISHGVAAGFIFANLFWLGLAMLCRCGASFARACLRLVGWFGMDSYVSGRSSFPEVPRILLLLRSRGR
jgi:hypothetical protein